MIKLSSREWLLALATGSVILWGGSGILLKPKFEQWKDLRVQQERVQAEIEECRKWIGEREAWTAKSEEVSRLLPRHPKGARTDVYWLSKMDNLATQHGLTISKRQAGEEKNLGDLYELPIECNEWEGDTDAIVRFLFDLQAEGGMFDVRHLLIKQKEPGRLRGRFVLSCAYTKDEEAKQTAAAP